MQVCNTSGMKLDSWLDHPLLGPLQFAAMLTWLVIGYFALFSQQAADMDASARLFAALALAGFLIAMFTAWAATRDWVNIAGLAGMPLTLLVACWFQPTQLLLILMCIFAGTLPYFLPVLRSLGVVALIHVVLVAAISQRSESGVWLFSLTNLGFAVFALFSSHSAMRERAARQELDAVHQELLATQRLLTERALEDERLRISRDLHDSLGHHLTALSLQLEVARHMTEGGARGHVDQAQSLAKLLLADVREVVADLREVPQSGLRKRIPALVQSSRAILDIRLPEEADKLNAEQEETMFRAVQEIITNCNRHSRCTRLSIVLAEAPSGWLLTSSENIATSVSLVPGHGLKGLRERAEALGGSLQLNAEAGLSYRVWIPR